MRRPLDESRHSKEATRFQPVRYPQSREELRQWLCEHLDLPAGMQPVVFAAIDAVLTRHRQLRESSKQEALQALSAGFISKIAYLQRKLSEKETTVSKISRYFERLVADLSEKAHCDPKTKLLNFPRSTQQFETFLAVEQRSRWCAIGLADIARLKAYNVTHGHLLGDRIIWRVARLMQDQVRADDLLSRKPDRPASEVHSRFGGDEFCFLVPGLSGPRNAFEIGERFREAVEHYDWTIENGHLAERAIRIDVGVVGLRLDGVAERRFIARRLGADLIACADELMYQAKDAPTSRVRLGRMCIQNGALRGC